MRNGSLSFIVDQKGQGKKKWEGAAKQKKGVVPTISGEKSEDGLCKLFFQLTITQGNRWGAVFSPSKGP